MMFVKSFLQFWYDFVIGDDWKIAVAVVLGLAVLVAATLGKLFDDAGLAILGGCLIVLFFAASLAVDIRQTSNRPD